MFFKDTKHIMAACRAWGFKTRQTSSGHWQVLQDMAGLGKDRVVAVFPGTSSLTHRLYKNQVAQIKRLTGKDIREAPPTIRMKPVPEPEPTPPLRWETEMARAEMKELIREAFMDILRSALLPERPQPVLVPEERVEFPGKPSRKRRVTLTEAQRREVAALYEAGERAVDLAKTYDVSINSVMKAVKLYGHVRTHGGARV